MAGRTAPDAGETAQLLRGELARLQRELDEHVRLNRMLGDSAEQFISLLAHDIKNPLAAIKVNVQGLKRRIERGAAPTPEHLTERLERIEQALEQTLALIASARVRVSTKGEPDSPLQRETIDLIALARAAADPYQQMAGKERLRLECRSPVLMGMWDAQRLQQAIQAVLDNALKFSPHNEPVTILLERDAQQAQAVLRCTDGGIGIPARDLAHVCERFYRAENVVGRYRGAGIGLFEALAAVTAHGGSLDVESVEGSGSSVTLRLPLH